jgi:hypothetical protein
VHGEWSVAAHCFGVEGHTPLAVDATAVFNLEFVCRQARLTVAQPDAVHEQTSFRSPPISGCVRIGHVDY